MKIVDFGCQVGGSGIWQQIKDGKDYLSYVFFKTTTKVHYKERIHFAIAPSHEMDFSLLNQFSIFSRRSYKYLPINCSIASVDLLVVSK